MQQSQSQSQHQHQQHQQRTSFFRANRPGNLNIIDTNDTLTGLSANSNLTGPFTAPGQTSFTTQSNYAPNTSISSPHYQSVSLQSQAQHQSISPSYNYHQSAQQQSKPQYSPSYYEQQSYTPKYSPCPSSAQIVNKQNYFNFDLPNVPNVPNVGNVGNVQNVPAQSSTTSSSQIPQSPHLSNQTKQLNISTNYNTATRANTLVSPSRYLTQQNYHTFNSANHQFNNSNNNNTNNNNNNNPTSVSNNYQKQALTPTSALPFQTYSNQMQGSNNLHGHHLHQHNHSLSVPNSPIHPYHNHHHSYHHQHNQAHHHGNHSMSGNQHSTVFQFNTNTNNLQNVLQDSNSRYHHQSQTQSQASFNNSSYFNTAPSVESNHQQQQQQDNTSQFEFSTVVDDVTTGSGLAESASELTDVLAADLEQLSQVTEQLSASSNNDTSALVTANTYGENDVDMVQEVINDMIQKEDIINNIKLSPVGYLIGNEGSSTSPLSSSSSPSSRLSTNSSIRTPPLTDNPTLQVSNLSLNSTNTNSLILNSQHHYDLRFESRSNSANPLNDSGLTLNTNNSSNKNESILDQEDDHDGNQSKYLDKEIELMDINNNSLSQNSNLNSLKKNNLDSLSSVANLILAQQTSLNNKSSSSSSNNKPSIYSLSNLSEAASAEFMLNYANNSVSNSNKSNLENDTTNKLLHTFDQADAEMSNESSKNKNRKKNQQNSLYLSHSPQPYKPLIEESYGLNLSLNETKLKFSMESPKSVDSSMNPGSSGNSIQSCIDCGKIFTNKSALAKHRLIHSNERKYACSLCDKSFKRQDHLNGHLLTHQDKKPFVCKAPGCDKSYCDSRSLKRHVESQHQDYLALLANGNQEALNYLPSIGKIKANLAPNLQHEISVHDIMKTNSRNDEIQHHHHKKQQSQSQHSQNHNHQQQQQYSPITPVPGQNEESKMCSNLGNDLSVNSNQRPKNFFTFEEPKPERCKICGKGFKNIPALNGHMRLHGGFIKTKFSVKNPSLNANEPNNDQSQSQPQHQPSTSAQNITAASLSFNDDSMSSNCSSNNSFSSNLSSNTANFNLFGPAKSQYNLNNNAVSLFSSSSSIDASLLKPKPKDKTSLNGGKKMIENSLSNDELTQLIANTNKQALIQTQNHNQKQPKESVSQAGLIQNYATPQASKTINMLYSNQCNQYPEQVKKSSKINKISSESSESMDASTNSPPKFISNILQQKSVKQQKSNFAPNRFLEPKQLHHDNQPNYQCDQFNLSSHTDTDKQDSNSHVCSSISKPNSQQNYESLKEHSNNFQQIQNEQQSNSNEENIKMLSKQIYNITTALLNQQASFQVATAAAVAAVASINSSNNQHQSNISGKPKPKPMPLVIPSDISAFQQQKQQLNNQSLNLNAYQRTNIPFYQQLSTGSAFMPSHIYPHATLLKSPRLLDYDTKKQYTPPPMLSPFRKGPGLFYNPKQLANIFSMQSQPQMNNKLTMFNHSVSSSSYVYPSSSFYFNHSVNSNFSEPNCEENENSVDVENREDEEVEESLVEEDKRVQVEEVEEETVREGEEKEKENVHQDPSTPKPTIKRARLMSSQVSQANSSMTSTFFPDESETANEAIKAALFDCTESIKAKPFINVGSDFQAFVPELKNIEDSEKELSLIDKEDLLFSGEKLQKLNSTQFTNYLDLICKSSLVYGSSDNLELGLHILNFYEGDFKKSIKAFFDDSIDLPLNHPISTYKYTETDIWSQEEIKKFELSILKHDKLFSEIAKEIETKTLKQCIEFYYLWKKVMSDSMKKKWKSMKKNRTFVDTIDQNAAVNQAENTTNENGDDEQLETIDSTLGANSKKNYLKESQGDKNEKNCASRMSTPSPSLNTNGIQRYECDKCNLVITNLVFINLEFTRLIFIKTPRYSKQKEN